MRMISLRPGNVPALSKLDEATANVLAQGESVVGKRYVKIVSKLSEMAMSGDKKAAELLLENVIRPGRERVETKVASINRRGISEPLGLRLRMLDFAKRIGLEKATIELTATELQALPPETKIGR